MSIVSLFCEIDDFYLHYMEQMTSEDAESDKPERRGRPRNLHPSEVMTILVNFHHSGYRSFKHYYQKHVCRYLRWAFPKLVSYNRFVELTSEALVFVSAYLQMRYGKCNGISFIDSTSIVVCRRQRIQGHRVFAKEGGRGMNSLGWFYGFKLHLIVNTDGEVLAAQLTPGNTNDRKPVRELTQGLFGKLYADKGYVSEALSEALKTQGICLVSKVNKNMRPEALSDVDAALLKKRMCIESVIEQLKHQSQLEHTRHRSYQNFRVNVFCALIAYTYQQKKPSVNLRELDEIKDSQMQNKS